VEVIVSGDDGGERRGHTVPVEGENGVGEGKKKKRQKCKTWHMPRHLRDYCRITHVVRISLLERKKEGPERLFQAIKQLHKIKSCM
jgi:hypothetical protein